MGMATLISTRLTRILAFLVGARNPRIFSVLSRRGFRQADLEEGWRLFSIAAGARLSYVQGGSLLDNDFAREVLAMLDVWENTWFPVVSATLRRHYPELHEIVFQNLGQTEGSEVLVSVSTLLERLATMAKSGAKGKEADALLENRGLTAAVRSEATALIEKLKKTEEVTLPQIDPTSQVEQSTALEDVSAWHRIWGRGLLRVAMGCRGDVPGERGPGLPGGWHLSLAPIISTYH
jgi:hypothetical protein